MKNLFRRISSPQDTHEKSGGRQKFTLIELLMIKFYKRGVSLCLITSPAKSAPALRREAVSGKARSQSFSLSSSLIPMFSLSVFLHRSHFPFHAQSPMNASFSPTLPSSETNFCIPILFRFLLKQHMLQYLMPDILQQEILHLFTNGIIQHQIQQLTQ